MVRSDGGITELMQQEIQTNQPADRLVAEAAGSRHA
jgi:hypothetical protein